MHFVTYEEYKKIRPTDKWSKQCPFCSPPEKYKDHLLWENDHRMIIYPSKPCGGVERYKKHLLCIPKAHVTKTTELTDEVVLSKQEAEQWLELYFGESEYCSYLRHTDWIKSILHLHYHYFWWNIRYRDMANSLKYYDEKWGDEVFEWNIWH